MSPALPAALLLALSGCQDKAPEDTTDESSATTSPADTETLATDTEALDDTATGTDDTGYTDNTGDTERKGDSADTADVIDTGPFVAPDAVSLSVLFGIHTGEGRCIFEDIFDTSNVDFIACRDGLKTIAAGLEDLGVRAEWQIQPGFVTLLLLDGFDFQAELADRGHGVAAHMHSQCLESEDDASDLCGRVGVDWGNSTGGTEPPLDVFALRARSLDTAFSATGREPTSVNIWGESYRLNQDAISGSRESVDMLISEGWGVPAVGTSFQHTLLGADGEPCYDGMRKLDEDTWKAVVQPVTLHGTSGGEVVHYSTATPLWGASSYNDAEARVGLAASFDCLTARVADPEGTGWRGEIFTWTGLTHLHNMMNDLDGDGVFDGLQDVASHMAVAQALAEERSTEALALSVDFPNIQEMEAMRLEAEAAGANHDY